MNKSAYMTVEEALVVLRDGRQLILVDDEGRENEGDLIMAAEAVTAEDINFMTQYGRGLVCMPMLEDDLIRLGLPMMTTVNTSMRQTPFAVSFEAREGVTTGISAFDRARSVQVAADTSSTAADLVMPGHMFPLRAAPNGVLERAGHTEGSVDLMRLAGLKPAAVLCEIMHTDGSMASGAVLEAFSKEHNIPMLHIDDIIEYRLQHENHAELISQSRLPLREHGDFDAMVYRHVLDDCEHVLLWKPPVDQEAPVTVRIHSECLTGDVFGSSRCDCGEQLDTALSILADVGGALVYLRQEGRGIGLSNKLKAYALQDAGCDTVEANERLGFAADLRNYAIAAHILRDQGVTNVRLLTNNPDKVSALERYGVGVERLSLETQPTQDNISYLQTKRDKLGHLLELEEAVHV